MDAQIHRLLLSSLYTGGLQKASLPFCEEKERQQPSASVSKNVSAEGFLCMKQGDRDGKGSV